MLDRKTPKLIDGDRIISEDIPTYVRGNPTKCRAHKNMTKIANQTSKRGTTYWVDDLPEMTIGAALRGAVERFGNEAGYKFNREYRGLADIQDKSTKVAKALLAAGISKNDKVAVFMANHPEWPELYFGALRIGTVLVALNTRWTASELEYCLSTSGAKILILKREKTAGGRDYGDVICEVLPELAPLTEGPLTSARVAELKTVVDLASEPLTGCLDYEDFISRGEMIPDSELAEAEAAVRPRDLALIQYTSGTTSFPKGAMLHHAGMIRGGKETPSWLRVQFDDVLFSVQPFYHGGGSIFQMLAPVVSGCVVITQIYFDAGKALELMEEEGATTMIGHQPHYIEYMNHPTFGQRKLKIERALVIAPPEIYWMVREKFGIDDLVSGYGMTETHLLGTATSLSDDSMEVRFNTQGRPIEGVKIEIRDEHGTVLGPEEEGEIFVRVPYPMLGYLNMPEQTEKVLSPDGWYRSGDKGMIRADGNLCLLGRVRDMIRVGGENLSGAEVERTLLAHPSVKQAAAIAVPDKRLGEVVVAFVELKSGSSAPESELTEHCRKQLAGFKVPRQIHFIDKWPLSGSGKIQKHLLQLPTTDA